MDLGLDTIYWQFKANVPMYAGGGYEITKTKLDSYRLWWTKNDTQLDMLDTLDEAKQSAELHKQFISLKGA